MATADTVQGIPLPTYDDQPEIPDHLAGLWYAMIARGIPRFSTTDMRDERIPSPVDGMVCVTGSGTTTRLWMALGGWRELARASSATALAAVMPPSDRVDVDSQIPITATAWAALPTPVELSLVLPAPAMVRLQASTWLSTAAGVELRCGIRVSGATAVAPEAPSWGTVAIQSLTGGGVTGTLEHTASKEVQLVAGTNSIRLDAYKVGAGTAEVRYPSLSYQVVRWL